MDACAISPLTEPSNTWASARRWTRPSSPPRCARCSPIPSGGGPWRPGASHGAEALIARGDPVYVLDTLPTGSMENIEHLKSARRFHYAIDSVTNEPVAAELIDRVDVVFHLAAAVGVRLIVESPVNTIETNVHGTEMVLKLANKKKKKVLVASTSEVYGKSE